MLAQKSKAQPPKADKNRPIADKKRLKPKTVKNDKDKRLKTKTTETI